MTPHQVDLVQSSFAEVAPIADAAAAMFYGRLFEIAPEVKALFHGDMAEQRRSIGKDQWDDASAHGGNARRLPSKS